MPSTENLPAADERLNRCIELIVAILRRYGAIELTGQQVVLPVTFRDPDPSDAGAACVRQMQVEEIEYLDEGSFALRLTEAIPAGRSLTRKAAAAHKAQTEQRIVVRRNGAAQLPRIAPQELDRVREAAEAFDQN